MCSKLMYASYKKTKIVCTIGPSSWEKETLKKLALAGMDAARLNLSHGTHEEKRAQIKRIREVGKETGKPLAIIADLQGPKLRLGSFEPTRTIIKGERIHLSISPLASELPLQFDLAPFVKKNHRIFLNDGLVELKVTQVVGKTIFTVVQNSGWVSSNKGVNVPDTNLGRASFTDKDLLDAQFALKEEVDFIALSFVQTAKDLKVLRDLIKKEGSKVQIIAKIEKKEAILNLEEIVQEADLVMVARGDLAIEIGAEEVPIIQQKMVRLSRQYQTPVIVATQMLESMVENPRPTRAETSDVAKAVLDQVDAVMLSSETASGKYPLETVETMQKIILSVEKETEFITSITVNWQNLPAKNLTFSAIAASAANLAQSIKAKAIVVSTATGRTAKLLASFRPDAQIIAVTHNEKTLRVLNLTWGVNGVVVEPTSTLDTFIDKILTSLTKAKFTQKGDQLVVITGTKVGISGLIDTIKLATV